MIVRKKNIVLVVCSFFVGFNILAQKKTCPEKMSNSLQVSLFRCKDDSFSYSQPPSSPLRFPNPISIFSEVYDLLMAGKLESFSIVPDKSPPFTNSVFKNLIEATTIVPDKSPTITNRTTPPKNPNKLKDERKPLSFKISDFPSFSIRKPQELSLKKLRQKAQKLVSVLTNYIKKTDEAEGYCGATAASNAFTAYCSQYIISPLKLAKQYMRDFLPGVLPTTLMEGLNKAFKDYGDICHSGKWEYYYSEREYDFFASLLKHVRPHRADWEANSPAITLLLQKGFLHYVTVVGIQGLDLSRFKTSIKSSRCLITYNEYGQQKKTTCKTFSQWAKNIQSNKIFKKFLKPYTRIVFKKN